jgi:hypothetical protein
VVVGLLSLTSLHFTWFPLLLPANGLACNVTYRTVAASSHGFRQPIQSCAVESCCCCYYNYGLETCHWSVGHGNTVCTMVPGSQYIGNW